MEEIENGQQEMQEKISRATKMVIKLTKGKWITDDPEEPASRKDGIDPFIVPSLNNHGEQKELRKNPSKRSNLVDMQQRCSLLDKKLKEIEGVNDLGNVDPRELAWSLIWLCRLSSNCQNLKSMMESNALRTIWPRIVTRWQGTPITKIC